MTSHDNQAFLNEELKYVREKLTEILKGTEIVACHIAMVQVKIKYVKCKVKLV